MTPPDQHWSVDESTVESYIRAGEIWFPARAKRVFRCVKTEIAMEYTVTHVARVEDGAGLYGVRFEPGTRVTDQRSNAVLTVGRDGFSPGF